MDPHEGAICRVPVEPLHRFRHRQVAALLEDVEEVSFIGRVGAKVEAV